MSTSNPPPGSAPPPAAPSMASPPRERQIVVVSHCGLFYWWPVWAVGFLMFLISMISGQYMVTVPAGTTAKRGEITLTVEGKKKGETIEKKVDVLVLPAAHPTLPDDPAHETLPEQPRLHMSGSKNLGVLFVAVLLLVIAITNIPLRGLWSVIALVLIISVVIIFALLEWWATILFYLSFLDIRINAAGYLVISIPLFVMWLLVMLLFDRQVYMVFTPGGFRVRQEIGDAETAYDVTGMTIQKQRSDLFRHWILGLGSGDLIVKTAGANAQEFHMPNVLFIGRKVNDIEEMLRQRQVVGGGS
jgi:hypothetical protein